MFDVPDIGSNGRSFKVTIEVSCIESMICYPYLKLSRKGDKFLSDFGFFIFVGREAENSLGGLGYRINDSTSAPPQVNGLVSYVNV